MITVRFPSGFSVQYNSATYLHYLGTGADQIGRLSARKDGPWIADVPISSGAIIEVTEPCRTYNANRPEITAKDIKERLHGLSVYDVAEIKAELGKFDAKRKAWK